MTDPFKKQAGQRGLHLVRPPLDPALQATLRQWLLEQAPDPLPDDVALVATLEGVPNAESWQLRQVIDGLVLEGHLDKVQIGRRAHLTRRQPELELEGDEQERFQVQVALDIEHERILLYRVLIVIEVIVLLIFLRSFLLAT